MLTTKAILKAINNPHLDLVKGDGYYYFVYDDGVSWDTYSVYTNALNHLTLDMWISDGKDFLKRFEGETC